MALTTHHSRNTPPPLLHDHFTMCYYQPIFVECPACRNVVSREGKDRECKDYIQTRDREMARMHRWRAGSRERAPPTPFIFGWCQKYGKTERDPVTVVSERACESCLDARWTGEGNHPSPSDSETSMNFARDGWLSPHVQAPLTPLTSIEDELDNDKMELDFPSSLDAPGGWTLLRTHMWCLTFSVEYKGRAIRHSERIRAREEKKAEGGAAQNRTTGEQTRGRPPTSSRRK